MKEVFVDTTGWVALTDTSDNLHTKAQALNKELLAQGVNYITSNFVLDESYTLLLSRTFHNVAVQLGEEIRASRIVSVVHANSQSSKFPKSWRKRPGRGSGVTPTRSSVSPIAPRSSSRSTAASGKGVHERPPH